LKARAAAVSDTFANQWARSGAILPFTSALGGLCAAATAAVSKARCETDASASAATEVASTLSADYRAKGGGADSSLYRVLEQWRGVAELLKLTVEGVTRKLRMKYNEAARWWKWRKLGRPPPQRAVV